MGVPKPVRKASKNEGTMLTKLDPATVEGMKNTMSKMKGNGDAAENDVATSSQAAAKNKAGVKAGRDVGTGLRGSKHANGPPAAGGKGKANGQAGKAAAPKGGRSPKAVGKDARGSGGSGAKGAGPKGVSARYRYVRDHLSPKEKNKVKLDVTVYGGQGGTMRHEKAMTVETMMKLLGWTVVGVHKSGDKGTRPEYDHVGKFHLFDLHKNKILLANNSTNRPFRPGLARRYMLEILRQKWQLNGETMVFDWDKKAQSAQHRGAGFILATQALKKEPDRWGRYWGKGPITMECIVVQGINPHSDVVDTIDQGQKRTFGDVIYRDSIFGGADVTDGVKRKLSNILAGATRLVWLRQGGKSVSDAPQFPLSEGLDFIEQHPRIIEAVDEVWQLEGGMGQDGGKISDRISIAYAAGLYYLMMTCGTDPDEYITMGPPALDFSMAKKAAEFWRSFAEGAELKANDPILVVRDMVARMSASGGQDRDEILGMVIKAFNYWVDGHTADNKKIRIPKVIDKKSQKEVLGEDPRLGGIDIEGREADRPEVGSKEDAIQHDREGSRAGKGWAEGDEAWVKLKGGDPWFGVINSVYKTDDGGMVANLTDQADGKDYEEPLSNLYLKYPG
jgi:hypothetical protein